MSRRNLLIPVAVDRSKTKDVRVESVCARPSHTAARPGPCKSAVVHNVVSVGFAGDLWMVSKDCTGL